MNIFGSLLNRRRGGVGPSGRRKPSWPIAGAKRSLLIDQEPEAFLGRAGRNWSLGADVDRQSRTAPHGIKDSRELASA